MTRPVQKIDCDKCGKCMTDDEGNTDIGLIIGRASGSSQNIRNQFGRYEKEMYYFCYECWLDSMMGK